nr:MAG TPA: DNA adenine methylase [Caudoviricetes sp.]
MRYVGSKNRLSKELAPIIQSYITEDTEAYIEPFVGGANMIDKINHHNKIGSDLHKELIALLNYTRDNYSQLPETFSEEEYNHVKANRDCYESWYVGLVGFCGAFGSAYMRGFARDKKTGRDIPAESIRSLVKQAPNLQNIKFECKSFLEYDPKEYKNCVFYLDPPYRATFGYSTGKFPYEEFDKWAVELSKNNTVLISEYEMPEDKFECIWGKEHLVNVKHDIKHDKNKKRIEKLFKVKGGK